MASIGLLDYDLTQWQQPVVFNLELMKFSTYFKNQRDLVKMLDAYDFERYSTIVVSKDYEDDNYPIEIFNNPKTLKVGRVFSGGKYSPLPLEIEQLPADTSIYKQMERYYRCSSNENDRFNVMLNAHHFRLSLDEKNIWSNWKRQTSMVNPGKIESFIIHDKNLGALRGAPEVLQNFLAEQSSAGRRIGLKYPVAIFTKSQARAWGSFKYLRSLNHLHFYQIFEDTFLEELILNSVSSLNITYLVTLPQLEKTGMERIFKQAIFLGAHGSKLLLYLVGEESLKKEEKELFTLLNNYFSVLVEPRFRNKLTFYRYAKRFSKWLKIDLINLFEYVRINHYALFKLFYECQSVVMQDNQFQSRYIWKPTGGRL